MSSDTKNNKVLLIVAYSERNLGIRYISNYLLKNGFEPTIVFFKTFESLYSSSAITDYELGLLKDIIDKENYLFVALNLHSSSIVQEVDSLIKMLQEYCNIPLILGGAYPTTSPKDCATKADLVLRGDGEINVLKLAKAIQNNLSWKNIPGACFFDENDQYIELEQENPEPNLDEIAYPLIGYKKMFVINYNSAKQIDPQLTTDFYELSTSRGCPFSCSYCCASALAGVYKNKSAFLRYRSVDSVIKELKEAVQKNPDIKEIRFWDEVFPSSKNWVEEFAYRFKKEIGLKFHIFGHPLTIKEDTIKLLVDAGLYLIAVGFQSGSPNVRNKIFNRPETNEQIIQASKILSACKVPRIYYDLMVCHPLETLEELKETFDLCMKLEPTFRLQLHGLGILPGAEILKLLLERGVYTKNEINKIVTSSFVKQDTLLLGPLRNYFDKNYKKKIWATLIYLTQFPELKQELASLALAPFKNIKRINELKAQRKFIHNHLSAIKFCDYENLYTRSLNIFMYYTNSFFNSINKKEKI